MWLSFTTQTSFFKLNHEAFQVDGTTRVPNIFGPQGSSCQESKELCMSTTSGRWGTKLTTMNPVFFLSN